MPDDMSHAKAGDIAKRIRATRRQQYARAVMVGSLDPVAHRVGLGNLELVDGADPDAPARTVRRARAVCHYDVAWKKGQITSEEREAADRYSFTCDREAGAKDQPSGFIPASDPWSRTPPLTIMQAQASLGSAHAAVGGDATALLRLYVQHNVPAEEIARRRQEDRKVCMGRIKAALGRLAEHWGMVKKDR